MKRAIVFIVCLAVAGSVFASGSGGGGMASRNPASAEDWYNVGYEKSNAGKYQEAIGDFKSALSLKGDYAEAYNMLGFCTRKLGDLPKAIGYYETALKLKPNFPEAREYFGETWLQQGNLAKAVQQYVILQKAHNKNADELLEKISDYVNQQM